jgi:O-acetyl-ADP-ribose deacetylase (regulator of RNase III)
LPFEIIRNDITKMTVDAIVNTANPRPVIGAGVDSAIHDKAGPELLAARQKIGAIRCGEAAITPAFQLNAQYVIHTVGPVWDGGSYGEETL